MSFTQNSTGRGYAPGWILAEEICSRETAQINANHAQVITLESGAKIVPMGAVIPSNDANAKGILYEDVEVTTGNMPGSIVTKGAIYEDRCAVSDVSYSAVTPETGDNPAEKGWYERSGSAGAYVYTLTTDTTVASGKTYYAQTVTTVATAAKTALTGITFKTVPTVTRPNFSGT